ncbi:MAG: preprotein translocase subunit SecE [Oligosphaeraceae bacterium]
MTNPIKAIQNLYFETVAEMKKCTWPTRKELIRSTAVVLTSLALLTVMVLVFDWVSQGFVRLIAGM